MADGYAATFNGYDNQIYCVGRGPSQQPLQHLTRSPAGTTVVIKGTVTDISAGTTQTEQAGKFPNGVPVASDASMKDWMGYVYQDQERPNKLHRCSVTISVVDPNSNYPTSAQQPQTQAESTAYHGHLKSQATTQSPQHSQEQTLTIRHIAE